MVYQLIYLSRSRHTMSDDELDEILAVSRRNNANRGVTGMLLYAADTFLQVLEGPKLRVDALFDELFLDDRHLGARVLYSGEVEKRSFENWTMGYERLDEDKEDHVYFFDLGRTPLNEQLPEGVSEQAKKLIDGFSTTKLRAA